MCTDGLIRKGEYSWNMYTIDFLMCLLKHPAVIDINGCWGLFLVMEVTKIMQLCNLAAISDTR